MAVGPCLPLLSCSPRATSEDQPVHPNWLKQPKVAAAQIPGLPSPTGFPEYQGGSVLQILAEMTLPRMAVQPPLVCPWR